MFTIAPATCTPCFANSDAFSTISSIGRPDAALADDDRRRPEARRHDRVRQPDDRPDACVPRALDEQHVMVGERGVRRAIRAPRSSTTSPAMYAFVKPRGMCTGLSDRVRLRQPEGRAHQDGVLVGRLAVVDDGSLADGLHEPGVEPAPHEPLEQPEGGRGLAAVLAGRREVQLRTASSHVAGRQRRVRGARSTRQTRALALVRRSIRSGARGRLALDQRDAVAQPSDVSASTASVSRYGPSRSMTSATRPEEDRRVGDEELRLVVVADERQSALEDAALLDVGDLGREVVALDAVGVVQEVEGVVDREAEAGAPSDQPLVDLRRDAHLGDLVEHLGRDGQQPDERGPGARARASPAGSARG